SCRTVPGGSTRPTAATTPSTEAPDHHGRRRLRSEPHGQPAGPQGPLRGRAHDPGPARPRGRRREAASRADVGAGEYGFAVARTRRPERSRGTFSPRQAAYSSIEGPSASIGTTVND